VYNEAFGGDAQTPRQRLVLDFDPKTKVELVTVNPEIVTKLNPHQVNGVKFMWDACFESIERLEHRTPGSGCILAHYMGKSLQVVTLAHTVLTNKACKVLSRSFLLFFLLLDINSRELLIVFLSQVKTVLIVCDLGKILNWVDQFKKGLPKESGIEVYEMAGIHHQNHQKDKRKPMLEKWRDLGGVMIIGKEMFHNLTNPNYKKKISDKECEEFNDLLVKPGADLVIIDDLLKSEKAKMFNALNKIATRRRVLLTGTPLEKDPKKYHCMIQFVKPNLLGMTVEKFKNLFANPIKNDQFEKLLEGEFIVLSI
jgi:transcriptional regulator ATRX